MPQLLLKSTAASKQGHGVENYSENATSCSTRRGQGEMGTTSMNLGADVGWVLSVRAPTVGPG